jgi:hypothetical protein
VVVASARRTSALVRTLAFCRRLDRFLRSDTRRHTDRRQLAQALLPAPRAPRFREVGVIIVNTLRSPEAVAAAEDSTRVTFWLRRVS